MAIKYQLKKVCEQENITVIQGEICGPKIQKNTLGLEDIDLFIFHMARNDIVLSFNEIQNIADRNSLKLVPLFEFHTEFNKDHKLHHKDLVLNKEYKDFGFEKSTSIIEGLVLRGDKDNQKVKIINKELNKTE